MLVRPAHCAMPEQVVPQSPGNGHHVGSFLALEGWTVKINCSLQTHNQLFFSWIGLLERLQICLIALQFGNQSVEQLATLLIPSRF